MKATMLFLFSWKMLTFCLLITSFLPLCPSVESPSPSFNIKTDNIVCIRGIPNEIFEQYIVSRIYQLPRYFTGLAFAQRSDYWLVSKAWEKALKPCLSDLFYRYYIMEGQAFKLSDIYGPSNKLNSCFTIPPALVLINKRMLAYFDQCDENIGNLIKKCIQASSKEALTNYCHALIDHGIYYLRDFQWFLVNKDHDIWFECFTRALNKGKVDKRDLSYICARYKTDLISYVGSKKELIGLLENFEQKKNEVYHSCDNIYLPKFLYISKEMLIEQIEYNKNVLHYLFNNSDLIWHSFKGYEEFRSEPIVKACFDKEENANFLCDLFYKEFQKSYSTLGSQIDYSDLMYGPLGDSFRDLTYQKDFLKYIKPRVQDIIAHKGDSDRDVCLLFFYAKLVFALQHYDLDNSFDANVALIRHFPENFTSTIEDSSLVENTNIENFIKLKTFLGKISEERGEEKAKNFRKKIVFVLKVILYLLRYQKLFCSFFLTTSLFLAYSLYLHYHTRSSSTLIMVCGALWHFISIEVYAIFLRLLFSDFSNTTTGLFKGPYTRFMKRFY